MIGPTLAPRGAIRSTRRGTREFGRLECFSAGSPRSRFSMGDVVPDALLTYPRQVNPMVPSRKRERTRKGG